MKTPHTITIVRNVEYGGFGLSAVAVRRLRELGHQPALAEVLYGEWHPDSSLRDCKYNSYMTQVDRLDPLVAQVVRELGSEAASGENAKLVVETYELCIGFDEHDGKEDYPRPYLNKID